MTDPERTALVRVLAARRAALEETAMLTRFVLDWCDGRIFSNLHMSEHDEKLLPMVFMALALGGAGLVPKDAMIVYERMSEAQRMGINGYPTFFSCRFLSAAQWARVRPAIEREEARRKEFSV